MSIHEIAPSCSPLDRTPEGSAAASEVVHSDGYRALGFADQQVVDRILCNHADSPALCAALARLIGSEAFQQLAPASLKNDCLRAIEEHPTADAVARITALVGDPLCIHLPADRVAGEIRDAAAGPDAPSSREVLERAGLQGRPRPHGLTASGAASLGVHGTIDLIEAAALHLPLWAESSLMGGGLGMALVVGAECIEHAIEAHEEGREEGRRIAVANGFVDVFEAAAGGSREEPASLRGLADPEAREAWRQGGRQALGVWATLSPTERATLIASPQARAELVREVRAEVQQQLGVR